MIKLRILRWGSYSGLSGWVPKTITYILPRGRQKKIIYKHRVLVGGNVMTTRQIGVMGPQGKEFWQPPKAGGGKEWIFP